VKKMNSSLLKEMKRMDDIMLEIEKLTYDMLKKLESIWERDWDMWFPKDIDIEEFQKEVEEYAKEHPDGKIIAWAFLYDSENKKKPKIWRFKRD